MFNTLPANPYPPSSEQMGAGGSSYVLPVASADTLGGVKVGSNLSIADGVLSAPVPYTPPAYSTDEIDTGRKWIDGSTVYERVFVLASPITVGSDWVSTGITIIGITKILNAFALRGNGATYLSLNAIIVEQDAVKVSKESTGWDNTTHIILQYTKTESEVE